MGLEALKPLMDLCWHVLAQTERVSYPLPMSVTNPATNLQYGNAELGP